MWEVVNDKQQKHSSLLRGRGNCGYFLWVHIAIVSEISYRWKLFSQTIMNKQS